MLGKMQDRGEVVCVISCRIPLEENVSYLRQAKPIWEKPAILSRQNMLSGKVHGKIPKTWGTKNSPGRMIGSRGKLVYVYVEVFIGN